MSIEGWIKSSVGNAAPAQVRQAGCSLALPQAQLELELNPSHDTHPAGRKAWIIQSRKEVSNYYYTEDTISICPTLILVAQISIYCFSARMQYSLPDSISSPVQSVQGMPRTQNTTASLGYSNITETPRIVIGDTYPPSKS